MKKSLSVALCLALSATLVMAGCSKDNNEPAPATNNGQAGEKNNNAAGNDNGVAATGYPIVKEKADIKVANIKPAMGTDYQDMDLVKELETKTNVHVNWLNMPEADFEQKRNLMITSGDLPDAFFGARFKPEDLGKYGSEGSFIPLEDLIEKYAPNVKALLEKRPDIKQKITAPDGHIYGLPVDEELDLGDNPFFHGINKAWLDKLGLPIPTTLDEFTEDLKAFKEKDPNGNGKKDEIHLAFMEDFFASDISYFFGSFGVPENLDHRTVVDGKVVFPAMSDDYKEALKYFHEKWWKQGLIDKEAFTVEIPAFLARSQTDETYGSFIWWEIGSEVVGNNAKDYVMLPPLKGPTGKVEIGISNSGSPGRDGVVITKAAKNPELVIRWADEFYEPLMAAQSHWGKADLAFKKDASGKLIPLTKEELGGEDPANIRKRTAPQGAGLVTKEDFATIVDPEPRAKQRKTDLETIYRPFMHKESYPNIFYNTEEAEVIQKYQQQFKDFIEQQRSKFIMEGNIDENWDNYLKQLKEIGADELLATYQKALDRYNSLAK